MTDVRIGVRYRVGPNPTCQLGDGSTLELERLAEGDVVKVIRIFGTGPNRIVQREPDGLECVVHPRHLIPVEDDTPTEPAPSAPDTSKVTFGARHESTGMVLLHHVDLPGGTWGVTSLDTADWHRGRAENLAWRTDYRAAHAALAEVREALNTAERTGVDVDDQGATCQGFGPSPDAPTWLTVKNRAHCLLAREVQAFVDQGLRGKALNDAVPYEVTDHREAETKEPCNATMISSQGREVSCNLDAHHDSAHHGLNSGVLWTDEFTASKPHKSEAAGCGHPNHPSCDHNCAPFLPEGAPAVTGEPDDDLLPKITAAYFNNTLSSMSNTGRVRQMFASEPMGEQRRRWEYAATAPLRAEIDTLRQDVLRADAQLRADQAWMAGQEVDIDGLKRERDEARAEVERLTEDLAIARAEIKGPIQIVTRQDPPQGSVVVRPDDPHHAAALLLTELPEVDEVEREGKWLCCGETVVDDEFTSEFALRDIAETLAIVLARRAEEAAHTTTNNDEVEVDELARVMHQADPDRTGPHWNDCDQHAYRQMARAVIARAAAGSTDTKEN